MTSVLTWLIAAGKGSSAKTAPVVVPDPLPAPLTVPMPGMPERSTPVTMPLASQVTPVQAGAVHGSVPSCQVDRAEGLPRAIFTANRALDVGASGRATPTPLAVLNTTTDVLDVIHSEPATGMQAPSALVLEVSRLLRLATVALISEVEGSWAGAET